MVRLVASGGHRLPLPALLPIHHGQGFGLLPATARTEARLGGEAGADLAGLELELRTESVVVGGSRLHVNAGDLLLGVPLSHSPPSHTGISTSTRSFTKHKMHDSEKCSIS